MSATGNQPKSSSQLSNPWGAEAGTSMAQGAGSKAQSEAPESEKAVQKRPSARSKTVARKTSVAKKVANKAPSEGSANKTVRKAAHVPAKEPSTDGETAAPSSGRKRQAKKAPSKKTATKKVVRKKAVSKKVTARESTSSVPPKKSSSAPRATTEKKPSASVPDVQASNPTEVQVQKPQPLVPTASAKNSVRKRYDEMGDVWKHQARAVDAPATQVDHVVVTTARANARPVRLATPSELWPGLMPRSSQTLHRSAELAEAEANKVTDQPSPGQSNDEPPVQSLATEVADTSAPGIEQPVGAIEPTPNAVGDQIQEESAEVCHEEVQVDQASVIIESEPVGLMKSWQSVPLRVSNKDETDVESSWLRSEVGSRPDVDEEPLLGTQSDEVTEVLEATTQMPDGTLASIEWLGMVTEESDASPSAQGASGTVFGIQNEVSAGVVEDQPDERGACGLQQSLEHLSAAVENLDEELQVVAPQVRQPDSVESEISMSDADKTAALLPDEDEEFDPDDHPEFASVLDGVETTRTASLVSRQIEAATARAQANPEVVAPKKQEIPVEPLFSGVASSIGSGLSSVAQSGRYAVMGVKYSAEDSKALMRKLASVFKRKKSEADDAAANASEVDK